MRNKSRPIRTGDRVQHKTRPHLTPDTVTQVFWTPQGDMLYLDMHGVEIGPFPAKNYQLYQPSTV